LGGIGLLVGLSTGAAWAAPDGWSAYFSIGYMDNDDGNNASKDTLSVRKSGFSTFDNPASCTGNTTWAVMKANSTAASKELMTRVLTSAYLAGRKVRLQVSGSTCSGGGTTGSPVFYAVAVDATQ
jgi:hypothetical protein